MGCPAVVANSTRKLTGACYSLRTPERFRAAGRAGADTEGSVSFTLRDSAADIAATIISSLGDARAEEVATAIRRKRGKKP